MALSGEDLRQHPRFRVPLAVDVTLPDGMTTTTTTQGVSREGLSLRLDDAVAVGEGLPVAITLPDGRRVSGTARCRARMAGGVCGMALEFDASAKATWNAFVDEEESTGSLWRMIGRIAAAPDDAFAPRGVVDRRPDVDGGAALRFHTVGENGLAYRLAFQKHPSDPPDQSDLCVRLPGFREPARRLVRRVLREDFYFRFDEGPTQKVLRARVVELVRGGWAWVQGDEHTPVGFVALGVGELLLVERAGQSVFPHLTPLELEQVACDTFRDQLTRPLFQRTASSSSSQQSTSSGDPLSRSTPAAVPLPTLGPSTAVAPRVESRRFREGFDAVRFAQAASEDAQVRRYGDREIFFHPSVWAKVTLDDGDELMGPTLQDGGRVCVLGLVGPGAPRVVRLSSSSSVSLLKPPRR